MSVSKTKEALQSQYPYRIELHAHTTPVSGCSEISPDVLVRTYAEQGYHGVVLTNHFTPQILTMTENEAIDWYLTDYRKACEAAKQYGMRIYLATEIRFSDCFNDYLLYGVDEALLRTCYHHLAGSVTDFRSQVTLPDSVFLQAHPFRNHMVLCDPAILDGIECMNMHPNHNSRVGIATRYAKQQNFSIKIAGTDFHHPGQQALSALRASRLPQDSFDLAKLLKEEEHLFELGDGTLWIP